MTDQVENLKLLIKFLGMTRSANNAEALVAMRKANEHLDKTKATWEEILMSKVKITIVEDPFKNMPVPPPPSTTSGLNQRQPLRPKYTPQSPPPPPPPSPPPNPSRPRSTVDASKLHMTYEAKTYADRNDIISAIKTIRYAFNHLGTVTLADAKRLVDNYIASKKPYDPFYDPFVAKPTPAGATARVNQYPGVCHKCGTRVAGGAGQLDGKTASGQYRIICAPGQCKTSKYAKTNISADDLADMV